MSTPVRPHSSPTDRGGPGAGPLPGAPLPPAHGDSAATLSPSFPRAIESGSAENDRNRLNVALEAIHGLAGCLDQLLRELRRGVATAQWRVVQEEVMRVRRLVTARPEIREGPPRDEGSASQPPPEPVPASQPPTPRGSAAPPTPRPGA